MSEPMRSLRPRRSNIPKKRQQIDYNETDDASQRDDSDSEPKLVIKEDKNFDKKDKQLERKYQCHSCKPPHVFAVLTDYLQHLKEQHQQKSKSHACPYCNYTYQNSKKLQKHILTAHKDILSDKTGDNVRKNKCAMCNFVAYTSRDMENHQRLHHLKRRFFRCTKCSYMTHVRARYTKHVKYHSMPLIKCDDCDFRTPYKWNLDRHTRSHGGGGPYQCSVCNFTAEIRQSLTVHETNHHDPPIGQAGKMSGDLERKPKNFPKRYNQVGASDFRDEKTVETASPTPVIESSYSLADPEAEAESADCIALKCEEKGCQFITSWDSEMQQHLTESHANSQASIKRKPLPMLIPLSPESKANNISGSGSSPSSVLNVPKVRVRPELAKIARETEIKKLQNNSQAQEEKEEVSPSKDFEKRNASFFDKLKERLLTSARPLTNQPGGVSKADDLKCWCTFEASSPDELSSHKKTHHTALSVSLGMSRCPKCRRRCKTSSDLHNHIKECPAYNSCRNSSQENTANSDSYATTSSYTDFELPLQADWDSNHNGPNSSGSSVEEASSALKTRRVFKCPYCPFWASTASRFHVHIVGHLNRKPFECSLCAYRSNWRWDITKHIKLKAVRDPAHSHARVLMTDETGRRNYSKYNKYLSQLHQQTPETPSTHGTRSRSASGEPPEKVAAMTPSPPFPNPLKRRSRKLSIDTNSTTPRSPPSRTAGQSLLKINPATTVTSLPNSPSKSTPTLEETKRTLWKCKRCNYRDSSKEVLLLHVKSHYEKPEKLAVRPSNELTCSDCPYQAKDLETLAMHKVHHRPNLEAIFKCYLCPYYVSTKQELLDHVRIHGQELAVVHQSETSAKLRRLEPAGGPPLSLTEPQPPPLLLDTRALPDTPMVWVSKPDGTFGKMLKCRHCPHVASRRAEVRDHETMHNNTNTEDCGSGRGRLILCPDCSFTCTHKSVMEMHKNMHNGSLGTIHCLVADNRSDAQQLDDLKTILGLAKVPALGPEPDLRDSRLVHNCARCPARFLCEKELRIHFRYHTTTLAYTCDWCSYAARQPAHLLAHQKAHSSEYQERTRYLASLYGNSQRYPAPVTACVEINSQSDNSRRQFAWIVVESSGTNHSEQKVNQIHHVFTCVKCPARYFKQDALEYHMTLHGSNNRFKCEECDYSSKTAQNLMKHQVVHRRQPEPEVKEQIQFKPMPQAPDICKAGNSNLGGNPNFVYPMCIRNGKLKEKKYRCHKCPSAFEKREQLRIHLSLHGSKQKYKCEMCDYAVKYYANYVQHIKKHQANAEAQASRRKMEVDNDDFAYQDEQYSFANARRKSTTAMSSSNQSYSEGAVTVSNQDKQTIMLMERKSSLTLSEANDNPFKCPDCPFSTDDIGTMEGHKRRHGIDRLTPPCPHCNYVPKKDENLNEHVKLHFTRMYKPEGYLILEMMSLKMRRCGENGSDKNKENETLIFAEPTEGHFLPITAISTLPAKGLDTRETVVIDPNTGETTDRIKD